MSSVEDIKRRVKSIESTKQITYSMRLVSSAKVQKVQKHLSVVKGFNQELDKFLSGVFSVVSKIDNIYFDNDSTAPAAVLVISSSRGLCGAYNVNVARSGVGFCKKLSSPNVTIVGGRIKDAFARENIKISQSYAGVSETPMYEEAQMIAYQLTQLYLKGKVSRVHIIYTKASSILSQQVVTQQLLPCEKPITQYEHKEVMIDPSIDELLADFMPVYIAGKIQQAMSEASVSEQSARITNMDSASKNADTLISKLTLEYNQLRQSEITNEITEIVNGASGVAE